MVTPSLEDTWADVTSPRLRRLVQNRLNQRAFRQRKLQEEEEAGIARRHRGRPKTKSTPTNDAKAAPTTALTVFKSALPQSRSSTTTSNSSSTLSLTPKLYATQAGISKLAEDLSVFVLSRLSSSNPSADMLIHLSSLNSTRALMSNMSVLGLPFHGVSDDDYISHFNSLNPTERALPRLLPPSLQPTSMQLTVVHHPWIDIFPFPSLRNILISREDELSDCCLCHDALGLDEHSSAGLLVWGNPWDPYGWEMTEEFARKWRWLFNDCRELVVSTNFWRTHRGEQDLHL